MAEIPLVFHYSGDKFPDYAYKSLRKAAERWPGRTILISDITLKAAIAGVEVVTTGGWYDREPFLSWTRVTPLSKEFRSGLWFHALERFFLLEQWAMAAGVSKFLHCELDVALYDSATVFGILEKLPDRLYFPRASPRIAGASWFFSSSTKALSQLTSFLVSEAENGNEMLLLARFLDHFPELSESAPSHYSIQMAVEFQEPTEIRKLREWGGVVDVQPIGTWLLGRDPRNSKNFLNYSRRYYEGIGSDFLSKLNYRFDRDKKCVTVGTESVGHFPVFAIHVHSKKVRRAYSPVYLHLMTIISRLPFPVPVTLGNFRVASSRLLKKITDPIYRISVIKN